MLAEQIEEKKAAQEEARVEYLKEREQVDAIARAIAEEDEAERLRKAQKVKDTKAWVAKFELREDLREQERQRLLEEEAQIARFAAEIERRQKATEGMREAQQAEKDRILEKLAKEKEENDRRRDEMEELINRLYFEEAEEKHRAAAKERLRAGRPWSGTSRRQTSSSVASRRRSGSARSSRSRSSAG